MVIAEWGVITVSGGPRSCTLSVVVSAVSVAAFLMTPTALAQPARSADAAASAKPTLSHSVQLQIAALAAEKAARTPAQRKIDSQLLYAEKRALHSPLPAHFPKLITSITTDAAGRVVVDVHGASVPRLLFDIAAVNGQVMFSQSSGDVLRTRVALTALETLAASDDVQFIARPDEAQLAVGAATSEGDVTHRAGTARSTFGVDGTGVQIGVLSDGVTSLAASQASGDLGPVTVLAGQAGPAGADEGTAMLEIVHDVAPGAQLYFATAMTSDASFAGNIRALRAAGCDVIVDDVFYYAEPVFEDGPIAQAVNDVTADGALYFSSAGNSGNLTDATSGVWEGDASSRVSGTVGSTPYGFVDVNPAAGVQIENPLAANPTERIAVLQWADRFGAAVNDYDLFLISADGQSVVGASVDWQNQTHQPIEGFAIAPGPAGRRIVIGLFSGVSRFMHLSLNGGRFAAYGSLAAFATAGQTSGHSAAVNAFSVAATPAHAAFGSGQPTGPYPNPFNGANLSETFSSDGPRRMFYAPDGSPYTPGNLTSTGGVVRQKPEITAADGVATSVPDFQPFYGTSAAAPHAAAIAALLLDAVPGLTRAQVRDALVATAIDIETPGVDRTTGAGIVDAYAALQWLFATAPGAPTEVHASAGAASATVSWTPPADNGGAAITGYDVQYSANGGPWTPASDAFHHSTATTQVVTGLTNGISYVFRVAAINHAGTGAYSTSSTPVVPAGPSALTITAPSSVNYNGYATIATKLTSAATHAGLPGATVTLYKRANSTKPWALFRTLTTSVTGAASTSVKMTANSQFQWRFAGTAAQKAATSATRSVSVRQVVSIAKTAGTIKHGSTVKFYGTVQPTSADRPVLLQQRVGTKWVTKASAVIHRQTMPNGKVLVGYLVKIRLNNVGTFTFRVYKAATATLVAGYSPTTAVRVT
jgi:subtilisin family serine protease